MSEEGALTTMSVAKKSLLLRWSLALVVLLLVGAVYSLWSLARATKWVRHTDEVRVTVGHLRSTLLDAETATRGYVIAGERAFLEPYDRAESDWRPEVDRVRALTTDNPDQQRRLGQLDRLVGQRLDLLTRLRDAYDAGVRGKDLTPRMLEGKIAMDAVGALIGDMEQEEVRLDGIRQAEVARRWEWTVVLFVAGAFGFLLLVGGAWARERAAEARRQAVDGERLLLEAVLAGIDDGITLQDRTGKLIFANASGARLIGFASPRELLAASIPEIMQRFEIYDEEGRRFPPEKLPARAVLNGSTQEAAVLLRHRQAGSGEEHWSNLRAYPVVDAAGQTIQAINVFRDVTAEFQAEERRKFLLRAVDELSSSLDYEATLTAVARLAVPALADWCAVDIVEGDGVKRLATAHVDSDKIATAAALERRRPPDPRATTGVAEIIRSGQPQLLAVIPRELLLAAALDAEHLKLIDELDLRSYIGVPLKARGKTMGAITLATAESKRIYTEKDLAFAQDLADRAALAIENARLFREVERARAAAALELAAEGERRREAEGASRFAEMFIGILGHDLRNPLNAVTMTATLLRRRGIDDGGALERILSSAQRMSNMVAQLLDLTRSRLAGGIALEAKPIDLGMVVSDVIDETRRAHPDREIRWESCGGANGLIDQDRLAQVVSNLVGNAVLHGDPSKPVTVTLTAAGSIMSLRVHNDGPPIPGQLLPVIFDPFRRTAARDERSKGLGLGLFISHQIVVAHGGTIDVTSTDAAGTTFTVALPRLSAPGKVASAVGDLVA